MAVHEERGRSQTAGAADVQAAPWVFHPGLVEGLHAALADRVRVHAGRSLDPGRGRRPGRGRGPGRGLGPGRGRGRGGGESSGGGGR